MHFINLVASFALLVATMAAPRPQEASSTTDIPVPVPTVPSIPEPKDDCVIAPVFICEHYNWGGDCKLLNNCVGSGPQDCTPLDGTASAIGPDEGFNCTFYKSDNCRATPGVPDAEWSTVWPGSSNLLEYPVPSVPENSWNDAIRSYWCFQI